MRPYIRRIFLPITAPSDDQPSAFSFLFMQYVNVDSWHLFGSSSLSAKSSIPKEIRQAPRVREGDTLIFESDERGVHLCPGQPEDVFAEYEGAWREGKGKSAEEINGWLRELRGHED